MKTSPGRTALAALATSIALAALAACSGMGGSPGGPMGMSRTLDGSQEVPPVKTSATGSGRISIAASGAVSGSVTTTGLTGTMAHIHMGERGKNGPVIIPLTRTSSDLWSVPPGAMLTAEQLKSYQAGGLYVNVHTEANKGGEIRTQLMP